MAFTYPQNHFKSESARCEACGNPDGNEIRFNDEVLYLHCVGCKSETAGAALLSANKEIGRLRQSISDGVPKWISVSERMPKPGQLIAVHYISDGDYYDAFRYAEDETAPHDCEYDCWMLLQEAPKHG